jgi:hypothetical protein
MHTQRIWYHIFCDGEVETTVAALGSTHNSIIAIASSLGPGMKLHIVNADQITYQKYFSGSKRKSESTSLNCLLLIF